MKSFLLISVVSFAMAAMSLYGQTEGGNSGPGAGSSGGNSGVGSSGAGVGNGQINGGKGSAGPPINGSTSTPASTNAGEFHPPPTSPGNG